MQKTILIVFFLISCFAVSAQKIDSIFLNLYTDSLKKGTYNYINVDGKTHEGQWIPLTSKELNFKSSDGTFDGNSLFIDSAFKKEKVTIIVSLKADATQRKEITIYIKKLENPVILKTEEEILNSPSKRNKSKKSIA